ncbi:hypothetical protein PQ465_10825 [Sphingobacterium oryzagri]|uniref:Uncharacterized protein n=1 Tax=Sphingobacterium oryzagri TaxID=3025669 RepID=A0ABY7WBH4_9SPHI|nr:hypothetical protein [Sphingobacterium sp. KACC 22765]WDF66797.1 hypothetical protein PQ465_10825 [Sphingobacterium sp. KACC 22765]
MHPKERHIAINKDGKDRQFFYYPGRHEDSFDVVELHVPNKVHVFSFNKEKEEYAYSGGDLADVADFIGKHILSTEY